jgi:hypothetical protein
MVGIEYPAGDMQGPGADCWQQPPEVGPEKVQDTFAVEAGGPERGALFLVRKTNAPLPFGSSCLPNARHRHAAMNMR